MCWQEIRGLILPSGVGALFEEVDGQLARVQFGHLGGTFIQYRTT